MIFVEEKAMENQRIRVTKRMLREALIRLLGQKPIEKIRVQEICLEAQINRTTFYKYYGTQYDLLNEVKEGFLKELEMHFENDDEPKNLVNVLAYMDEQRVLCLALISAISDDSFLESLLGLSYITTELEQGLADRYYGSRKEYATEFILRGAYSVVRKWLYADTPDTPEFIAGIIMELAGGLCGYGQ